MFFLSVTCHWNSKIHSQEYGADPWERDKEGKSPLERAQDHRAAKTAAYLSSQTRKPGSMVSRAILTGSSGAPKCPRLMQCLRHYSAKIFPRQFHNSSVPMGSTGPARYSLLDSETPCEISRASRLPSSSKSSHSPTPNSYLPQSNSSDRTPVSDSHHYHRPYTRTPIPNPDFRSFKLTPKPLPLIPSPVNNGPSSYSHTVAPSPYFTPPPFLPLAPSSPIASNQQLQPNPPTSGRKRGKPSANQDARRTRRKKSSSTVPDVRWVDAPHQPADASRIHDTQHRRLHQYHLRPRKADGGNSEMQR